MKGFIILVTCALLASILGAAGKEKSRGHVKHGSLTRFDDGQQTQNGKFKYPDSISLLVDIEGKPQKRVQLKHKNMDARKNGASKIMASSVYMSDDNSVTYREDCTKDRKCQGYALIQGRESTDFVTKTGNVLEIPSKSGAEMEFEDKPTLPKQSKNSHVNRVREPKNDASRIRRQANMTKRALNDDLTSTRVAKILYFVDEAFMNEFLPLGGNNYEATKLIVEDFVTLITNQITTSYQTLRQYNRLLSVAGTTYNQDVALQLVGIEFPPEGQNFQFSSDNVNDGKIYGLNSGGFLPDFSDFVASFSTDIDFDHAAALTGYPYISGSDSDQYEILGKAYVRTMCEQSSFNYGLSTSTQTFSSGLFNTLAHEIGHGFGMSHDDNSVSCPYYTYIMSPWISRPWEFSSCSAGYLESHTSSISVSNYKQTCLTSMDPGYFEDFCDGFLGSQYSLDEQCRRLFGPTSARCDVGASNEDQLRQGYVSACSGSVFHCYPEVRDGYCYSVSRALWGTNCVIDGILDPDNICYRETCQSQKICDITEPSTPEPTTPEPTSPEPTTPEPTTPEPTTPEPTTTTPEPTTPEPTTPEPTTPEPTTPEPCSCRNRKCCRKTRNLSGGCCSGCRGRIRGNKLKCTLIS